MLYHLFIWVLVLSCISVLLCAGFHLIKTHDDKYDGELVITTPDDGVKRFCLEIDGDPYDLVHKESVTFKIVLGSLVSEE